ncbi:MAG TPA: T9SS type A sorting domain-containing protein, partial [Saprospiraceae bacterium]|nr:T9SS type A sorting domain-containing protein [Saprospiraceae bacterium]
VNADMFDGINTLDLVLIQRHILGIAKLSSPYKMIAADVDGDNAIRVNDVLSIRKLILGAEQSLPIGKSWSFVSAHDKMVDSPWPFNEMISHAQLMEPSIDNNFVGVKLGDVDESASYNFGDVKVQPRTVPLQLNFDNMTVEIGKEYTLDIYSSNFTNIHGMQWTMSHKGMDIKEVDGRAIQLNSENTALISKDVTTLSWAAVNAQTLDKEDVVIRIKFVATMNGKISDMLKLSDVITKTEAYSGVEMQKVGIELVERTSQNSVFALSQNEPNPWREQTVVTYALPESGVARFTLFDITGKLIMEKNLPSIKGENVLTISRSDLKGITGMVLYKLEFDGQSAQRKMLIIE